MEKDIKKYIKDDNYIYSCLKKYGNTTINITVIDQIIRNIWHEKISKQRPADWAINPKYQEKTRICLKEIEDYISNKVGFPVKFRYVKSYEVSRDITGFLYGKCLAKDDPIYKDFWIIERINR